MFLLLALAGTAAGMETLATTVIQSSTAYSQAELFDTYDRYMGEPVTDGMARSIAQALQQKYLDDGYARPGFRISDNGQLTGIVRIELIEARISEVRFSGDPGPYRHRLERIFAELPRDASLRPAEIRGLLRRARRLPGLDVGVSTRTENETSGEILLEVDSDYKRVEGSVKLSNRGTEEIGRQLIFARLVTNGLFAGENSGGLFITTAKNSNTYSGAGVFANTALGHNGSMAQLRGSATSLEVVSEGVLLNQDRERYSSVITHPVKRRPDFEMSAWGGLDIENFDVFQDAIASRVERLRSIESGLNMMWRNTNILRQLNIDIEQALNGLGSRYDNYLDPDDPTRKDFTIARLRYVRLTRLSDAWTVRWDVIAQKSPHVLPSIKRFKVGGNRIGRGFEAAAVSGDSGLGTKFEFKRRVSDELPWFGFADIYAFYDLGAAWRNDEDDRASASSAGFGVSIRGGRLSGYVEVAKPLTHADADGRKDAGVFAELAMQF